MQYWAESFSSVTILTFRPRGGDAILVLDLVTATVVSGEVGFKGFGMFLFVLCWKLLVFWQERSHLDYFEFVIEEVELVLRRTTMHERHSANH